MPHRPSLNHQHHLDVVRFLLPIFVMLILVANTSMNVVTALSSSTKPKFQGGAGVGRLVLDEQAGKENAYKCHYDMVLVERLQGKTITATGLFIPKDDLPRMHLGRVLSVGPGREEENGRVTVTPSELQVGTYVIAKNPWGIGPKDEETADGKKLSYMRFQDIAAIVPGGLVLEDE